MGAWHLASVKSQQPLSALAFPVLSASFGSAWYMHIQRNIKEQIGSARGNVLCYAQEDFDSHPLPGGTWDGLGAYECSTRSLLLRLPHLSASKAAGVCPVPSGAIPRAEIQNLVQARQKGCELWDLCQLLWPWISS